MKFTHYMAAGHRSNCRGYYNHAMHIVGPFRQIRAAVMVPAALASACAPYGRIQPPDHYVTLQQGIATYYDADGSGACLFGPSPKDLMVAAMNADEYGNSTACGAYIRVTGPKGAVIVRIADLCPECRAGHLDLSREAFGLIADMAQGRVPITWQVLSPDLAGPIAYHFKNGSNQWWTAVQVRNHRNPVARLEYLTTDGHWQSVPRTAYNYFVQTRPAMGPGPYTFRVTDIFGSVLVDHSVLHRESGTVDGAGQFPPP